MKEKVTLLYVDDEPLNLTLFKHNFKNKFNVLIAESGEDGLKQIKTNPEIDAVISDMKMPGMNGVDFIKQAKKDFPHISYFILTGFDINEEIAEALNEKLILKYFRKPFNIKEIETSIFEISKN
ncbi:MAG TPA: response regulator [Bacteroidales bacterium]|jgi:response regulator RpfG family c-di-GMP phosphodiesterase|nr:response regulator [Bacteroidales bacterium]